MTWIINLICKALPPLPPFLFPGVQQNIVAEVLIHSLRGLLINYLLMTWGVSQMTLQSRWWDVCWVQRKGRGEGLADRLARFGLTEPGVCGSGRERVEVIAEHRVQRRAFVIALLGFEACDVHSWKWICGLLKSEGSPFPLLIPCFFPVPLIKAWSVQRREGFSDTPLVYGPPLPDTLTGRNVAHPGQEEKRPQICVRTTHVLKDVHLQY